MRRENDPARPMSEGFLRHGAPGGSAAGTGDQARPRQARSRRRTRPGNAAAEDTISKIVITRISRCPKSILCFLDTCAGSPHHASGRMCSRRSSGTPLTRSARDGMVMLAKNLAAQAAVPLRPGVCAETRRVAKAAPIARFGPGLGAGKPHAPLGAPSALGFRPPAWPARTAVDGARRCGGIPGRRLSVGRRRVASRALEAVGEMTHKVGRIHGHNGSGGLHDRGPAQQRPGAWPHPADGKGRITCAAHRLCAPIPGVRPPVSLQPRPVLQLLCLLCRREGWRQWSGHLGRPDAWLQGRKCPVLAW